MSKGTALVIAIGGLVVLSAACGGGGSTAPTPLIPTPTSTPAASSMSPNNNTSIPQNNPATGCSLLPGADAARGLGIVIPFHWTASSSTSGTAGYELYVMKVGAALPLVDRVTTTTDFTETECNAFVTDQNLQGWQWRTRPKDGQGQFSDWSPWASFEFSPCRLNDGTPCRAPE
jgi:hypothetical protein